MINPAGCLVAATLALVAVPQAVACRERVPNAEELAMHPALVIVTVKSATRVENPGWNTWRVIAEAPGNVRYDFRSTLSSDGCGQTPLPQNGDTWVVYYERARSGEAVDAFPLDHVREYDPRLADVH